MRKLFAFLIVFCLGSCVSPYDFGLKGSRQFLALEGGVFEKDKSWLTLNLTSNSGNSPTPVIIRDAEATLYEDGQARGTYYYDYGVDRYFMKDPDFQGKVGAMYHIEVLLSSGETYISEPEKMLPAEKIESFSDVFVADKSAFEVLGKLPAKGTEAIQYLFNFATFEQAGICATCVSGQQYVREDPAECASVFGNCTGSIPENKTGFFGFGCVTNRDCWNYKKIREQVLFDDAVLAPGTERLLKLFEVPLSTFARYFLQVNQYRISGRTQNYYKLIENAGAASGTLFDPVPPLLTGNVHLKGDTETKAMGYFVVAGQRQYGYYVERSAAQGYPLVKTDVEKEVLSFNLNFTPNMGCRLPPLAYCTPNNSFITDKKPAGWIEY